MSDEQVFIRFADADMEMRRAAKRGKRVWLRRVDYFDSDGREWSEWVVAPGSPPPYAPSLDSPVQWE